MMDGVTEGMIIGVNTEVISAENMIVTAGGVDSHVHFISPQQVEIALQSGVTTFVGEAPGLLRELWQPIVLPGYGICGGSERRMLFRLIWCFWAAGIAAVRKRWRNKSMQVRPDSKFTKTGAHALCD